MGEKKGKGTGAQSAKGETPLKARDADQDQAFLSRDPVGHGRVGELPTLYTGPRGEDGHGGQRGGLQIARNPEAAVPIPAPAVDPTPPAPRENKTPEPNRATPTPRESSLPKPKADPTDRPPQKSPVKAPEPPAPSIAPQTEFTPPPSKTASNGAATPDLNKPVADEVKAAAPLKQDAPAVEAPVKVAAIEGPTVLPQPAVGTAEPMKAAPHERPAVVVAPPLELPKAAVSAPPPPAVEPALIKPKVPDVIPPKPPAQPPAQAPAPTPTLVATGDARAPGQDRPSADPAQESDSESDPFIKNSTEAVFHDGRLEVRHGRKVKTVRPHILPSGYAALIANPDPALVLKISIDETGNVRDVEVLKSAGSVSIDQPCRRAAFEWWFEPKHDKQGRPMKDVVPFTIIFR